MRELKRNYLLFRLSAYWGHRPSTIDRQRVRSCASLSSWLQLQPVSRDSASRSLLHVFCGLPLLRFPWGLQVRAWRVMLVGGFLRVYPIHLHLRFFISSSTSSCPVLCQRSLWLMIYGHKIFSIFHIIYWREFMNEKTQTGFTGYTFLTEKNIMTFRYEPPNTINPRSTDVNFWMKID